MLTPAIPDDEPQRIAALRSLNVMFTPAEGRFDRLTQLASRLLGTPIALLSLVGESCQWFKSSQGLDATETERSISFCGHAVCAGEVLVVEDTLLDARFADNPLVTGGPKIRFYAGYPLRASQGHCIGTLCVIDRIPRRFSDDQRELLKHLAQFVEDEVRQFGLGDTQRKLLDSADDMQRRSMLDPTTRVWNRAAIVRLVDAEMQRAHESRNVQVAIIRLENIATFRDVVDAGASDTALAVLAQRIRRAARPGDAVGYLGDATFLLLMTDCDPESAMTVARDIRSAAVSEPIITTTALIEPIVQIDVKPADAAHCGSGQALAEPVVAAVCAAQANCVSRPGEGI